MAEQITLEPVDPERHGELFREWLSRPHVTRWWGDMGWRAEQFLETPADEHALIVLDGRPVGYLRWQEVDREDLDAVGLDEIPDGAIDMDILLGEADERGRGVGVRALELVVERLERTTRAPLAGLCTSTANDRAIRAFEKAGFRKLKRFKEETFGEMWVLVRELRVS
jgi:RimJ/RimL family protein N-acetyltransferase